MATATAACASSVEAPRCGVQMKPSSLSSGLSGATGSLAKTSRAAPARWPDASASASAPSSTRPPRAQFTSSAPFFILRSVSAPTRFRVCSVSGTCSETTSARPQRSSSDTSSTPSRRAPSSEMKGS
jgi:hypothetical protein